MNLKPCFLELNLPPLPYYYKYAKIVAINLKIVLEAPCGYCNIIQ